MKKNKKIEHALAQPSKRTVLKADMLVRKQMELAAQFTEKAEKEWPFLLKELFKLAKGGEQKALMYIFDRMLPDFNKNVAQEDHKPLDLHKMNEQTLVAIVDWARNQLQEDKIIQHVEVIEPDVKS
jgi:hypothetical protein